MLDRDRSRHLFLQFASQCLGQQFQRSECRDFRHRAMEVFDRINKLTTSILSRGGNTNSPDRMKRVCLCHHKQLTNLVSELFNRGVRHCGKAIDLKSVLEGSQSPMQLWQADQLLVQRRPEGDPFFPGDGEKLPAKFMQSRRCDLLRKIRVVDQAERR